ncbi:MULTISPECIES: hypothetical protein [unclassified Pseudomonas]|uniref:hypothetical protein n=1 Tax=unclassified Pseudomonas TaxID=196821 RepID=UPI000C86E49C|nr:MULTISPECIES: hypothetical protein [unclassified Pseudomonas]PMV89766.1 hypothetical protein C1X55_32965 [Pseudomonas sp. GW460-C8]PMW09451.1 hypothetical protein C1X40_33045 [Pseudomonas sp. GW456-11-11-14-TSB2]PMW11120.1 hypothetical protein C1X53_32455 [Pseudomonas sp. GW456-E6]PMW27450.1 hypothetical protein C1X45_33065 [Pseudomonas sp. GW460-7]PMW27555.1 hypothetical protein C1X48_33855 [Pseudomonas sp. FW305-3-2-15-A-R2A1]
MIAGLATLSVSALAVGAGFLLPLPKAAPQFAGQDVKVVGRYCLIKPGERRPHCDGEEAAPTDPMLSAIKQMNDSVSIDNMDRTSP